MTTDRGPTRRVVLGALGATTVALAGCVSGEDEGAGGNESTCTGGATGAAVRGDPDAEITLEVYEDFSCPACHTYNAESFETIEAEYLEPELIRYEHRDLPFISDESWQAASAAREAYEGCGDAEFWEYKSALMAAGGRLESDAPDIFGEVAADVGLDADRIQTAAVDRTHDDHAQSDRTRGENLGVQGTPGFVVDGEVMDGLEQALNTIDDKLDS